MKKDIPNFILKDFYRLHSIISRIDANYGSDVNNPSMADKHHILIKEGQKICQKWINSKPPLKNQNNL